MEVEVEVERLRRLVGELEEAVRQLQGENERLRIENLGLREINEKLTSQMTEGSKSKQPTFVKANKPKLEKKSRKQRAVEQNKGRRRMTPTRDEVHKIESCPECGEQLSQGGIYYSREVIDIPPPQPVEVVVHEIRKGWCRQCRCWRKAAVNWAGIAVGNSRIGVRLMGLVAYMRTRLRLTIRIIQEYLATLYQVELSVGEINNLTRRVTEELSQVNEELKNQARASPVLHMDETGWREDGQNGYIWSLVTETPEPVRYFEYHHSRSGKVVEELLGHFNGHLVSDFYAAYNRYSGPHQRCWVHLLRDLQALREEYANKGEIVAWTVSVKGLYQYANEQLLAGLAADDRQRLYDRLWGMANQLGLQYAMSYDHPCCPLAKRLLRHLDELFQFVLHEPVQADNNLAERALRPLVVQRKISGGSRSEPGSDTRMKLATLFDTWRARRLNPLLECWRLLGYEPHLLSLDEF